MLRFSIVIVFLVWCLPCWSFDLTSHKTAGLEYPENTLEGFAYSLTLDVDAIEIDLHLTQDQKLVLSHDPVLDNKNCFAKNSHQKIIIAQTHYRDLKAIQCFNHKLNQAYVIPTFESVLTAYQASKRHDILLNVELKVLDKRIENNPRYQVLDVNTFHASDTVISQQVYQVLRAFKINHNIMLTSFSRTLLLTLKNARKQNEQFSFGLLFKGEYAPLRLTIPTLLTGKTCYEFCWWANWQEVRNWLITHDVDAFFPNWPQLTHPLFKTGFIRHFMQQPSPFLIYPWTPNTVKDWQVFDDYQQYPFPFSGIVTDKPTRYLQRIKKDRL